MAKMIASGAGAMLAVTFAVAAAEPARAQCRLCATPSTTASALNEKARITLAVDASLDFDRLVLLGGGDGSATLMPNGDRRADGSIAAMSGRAMVGSVVIRGEAGRAVRVELPAQIRLYTLQGSSITIDDVSSDLADQPKLDSAGNLSFRFGGRLTVSGDSEGDYRGDVPITVEYL
jgi:hypothetical protein